MSSSTDRRPDHDAVVAVVRRYHRVERLCSIAAAVAVALVAFVAIVSLPFLVGLLVAIGLLVLARAPVLSRTTTTRAVTDADIDAVVADFDGAMPPMLAFQWGLADDVRPTADGGVYDFSYAFGLQSATMTVKSALRSLDSPGTDDSSGDDSVSTLDITTTANDRSWGTYTITIRDAGDGARLEIEGEPNRRFGLRYLVQGALTNRYYAEVLAAQGYTVIERETSLSLF
ncbi:hypothetical protein [Natronorubrum sp. DTA28]|uniref:hypothetical protein n=1 Tax=Natronorubrum sp. DTA28 TaxID=3447019 RepID=UPI003F84CAF8